MEYITVIHSGNRREIVRHYRDRQHAFRAAKAAIGRARARGRLISIEILPRSISREQAESTGFDHTWLDS